MKNQFADLHIHSSLSDGFLTPHEIVSEASKKKLSCIAVTDHDCVDAIPILLQNNYSLEIVPAVELTSQLDDTEIHILGYFIDYREENLLRKLKELCQARRDRIIKMIDKLKSFGVNIEYEEVLKDKQVGSVGRLHLAQVLWERGYVKSVPEAFYKYIGKHAPCYVQRYHLLPEEAIKLIKEANGVPVLAHPHKINNDEIIAELIQEGISGIEVYHPDHTGSVTEHYLLLAKKYSILVTGGSDCHGIEGKKELGSIKIPYEWVEEMKERIKK
ncbi:MAG: PHP domain-containing protein [Candidatus Omnitrophota bacterium]